MSQKSGRTRKGQLKSLQDRMTPEQLRQRAATTDVRMGISVEHAKTRGLAVGCAMILRRGFFGRLKWLLRGK